MSVATMDSVVGGMFERGDLPMKVYDRENYRQLVWDDVIRGYRCDLGVLPAFVVRHRMGGRFLDFDVWRGANALASWKVTRELARRVA